MKLTATTCCGDDNGEYYRYCQAAAGFPDARSCTSAHNACCDSATDCVATDGTTCVASGTYMDADWDGDDDYCDSGIWYD